LWLSLISIYWLIIYIFWNSMLVKRRVSFTIRGSTISRKKITFGERSNWPSPT
jgi:hypothetical protein